MESGGLEGVEYELVHMGRLVGQWKDSIVDGMECDREYFNFLWLMLIPVASHDQLRYLRIIFCQLKFPLLYLLLSPQKVLLAIQYHSKEFIFIKKFISR